MAKMDWFRMYSEARNDKKLAFLSDSEFRVWFNLLCYCSEQSERGSIDFSDPELLAIEVCNGEIELLTITINKLKRLRMLVEESETISFVNWAERQYDKPSDAPASVRERVQKHRDSQKPAILNTDNAVKRDVTPCNAVKRDVTHRGEEIREEKNRGEGEGVATCAGVHENSAEPVDLPAPPPLLESDWATPAIQKQAERPAIPSPMDTPAYWKELEKEGYSPEEIVAGLAKMRNERNKDPDTMTSPAILGYLRRLMPDIRGQTQTANAIPKPKTPEELAKERKERQKEEERQAKERTDAYISRCAEEKGMTVDEYRKWSENENATLAAACLAGLSKGRRYGGEGKQFGSGGAKTPY
mgnify:FL=1